MATNKALQMVELRNDFYKDSYFRVLIGVMVVFAINAILVGIIYFQFTTRPEPRYFATDTKDRITPIFPLSKPVVTASELLQWANEAAVAAFTYNFANYRKALQSASQYFTPQGWKDFQVGLRESGNLKTVIDQKLVVSARATGAPQIIQQGLIQGKYAWQITMPILTSYVSVKTQITSPQLVTLTVIRVDPLQVPRGIAIANYVTEDANTVNRGRR